MKIFLWLVLLCPLLSAQELPNAPEPQPEPVKFFQYRTDWRKPPVYTNKQLLKSKVFWAAHAALWASMLIACHNPRSGEECGSESGSLAGVTALDFVAAKFFSPLYDFGAPAYGIQHYIRADLK